MPERSRRTGEWVRPLFTVLWETGLRESTILRLRTPEHYKRGARRLFISEDIDKARYKRSLPLTDAARKALDRVCPRKPGVLFAGVDEDSLRYSIEGAAKAASIERHVSTYDIRKGQSRGCERRDLNAHAESLRMHSSSCEPFGAGRGRVAADAVTRRREPRTLRVSESAGRAPSPQVGPQ
jgi:integrase